MSAELAERWREDNRRHLVQEIERLRARIEHADAAVASAQAAWEHARPPAIDHICEMFQLSPFERDVLLLSAGVELDAQFAALCADGDVTLGLALAMLDDAHWNALPPSAALRRWRLIRLQDRGTLARSALRIDERILHFLLGIEHLDADVAAIARMLSPPEQGPLLQRAAAERVIESGVPRFEPRSDAYRQALAL